MLIDQFMPDYQIRSRHETCARASPAEAYAEIRSLNLGESSIIKWLFRLRGLPARALTLSGLEDLMFTRLGERPDRELVLGIIGRFWKCQAGIEQFAAEDFSSYSQPGLAKAAWNFSLQPLADGRTRISTETRIQCTDPVSLNRFRRYWRLIGPFSGWTRKEMLRLVKNRVERSSWT